MDVMFVRSSLHENPICCRRFILVIFERRHFHIKLSLLRGHMVKMPYRFDVCVKVFAQKSYSVGYVMLYVMLYTVVK